MLAANPFLSFCGCRISRVKPESQCLWCPEETSIYNILDFYCTGFHAIYGLILWINPSFRTIELPTSICSLLGSHFTYAFFIIDIA